MEGKIKREFEFRMDLWDQLVNEYGSPPSKVPNSLVNEKKIYFGGRGIWRDSNRTTSISEDINGICVGALHTGIHYADDLTDTEVLYHYPVTEQTTQDKRDIESLKNAKHHSLPVFICEKKSNTKNLNLGWVEDWDDDLSQFLITFEREKIQSGRKIINDSEFNLTDTSGETTSITTTKPKRNSRFQFEVFSRYKVDGNSCCVLTGLSVIGLLDAAHLYPKSKKGTDDPRNGLPLAPTIHRALDSGVIGICPDDYSVQGKASDIEALAICYKDLNHLPNLPERSALEYLWKKYQGNKTK